MSASEFIATVLDTGEMYQSGALYPMGSGMTDLMATAQAGSMFALRVFVAPSSKTVQGYSFDFETAMEVKASDAVLRLGEAFADLPKIEQPKAEPKKAK